MATPRPRRTSVHLSLHNPGRPPIAILRPTATTNYTTILRCPCGAEIQIPRRGASPQPDFAATLHAFVFDHVCP